MSALRIIVFAKAPRPGLAKTRLIPALGAAGAAALAARMLAHTLDQALASGVGVVELCTRLRQLSRPACIGTRLSTSGRRWEQRGVWRTIVLMWRLRWAYWRGVPAEVLAEAYR